MPRKDEDCDKQLWDSDWLKKAPLKLLYMEIGEKKKKKNTESHYFLDAR